MKARSVVDRYSMGDDDTVLKGITEHLRHHFSELDTEHDGIPTEEWVVSLRSLLDICSRYAGFQVTKRKQVERLYEHWKKDPDNSMGPPVDFEVITADRKELAASKVRIKALEKELKDRPVRIEYSGSSSGS